MLIIDEFPKLGGNHTNVEIGDYTFDIGSFFFSEDSKFLLHFPEIIPHLHYTGPDSYSIARITPGMKIGSYPIDLDLDVWGGGPLAPLRYFASALYGRLLVDENGSAADFARHWIGDRFFRQSGLKSYMERLFGEDPANIESAFAQKRMRWVKKNARIREFIRAVVNHRRRGKEDQPVRQFVRPRCGFDGVYGAISDRLAERGVEFRLNCDIGRIEGCGETGFRIVLADGSMLRGRRLISTIPLSRSLSLCGLQAPSELRSANLATLFVSFSGRRGFTSNVLYNFTAEGRWKRLTMHSDFYGMENGREYFSVECISRCPDERPETLFSEFGAQAKQVGIFDGELALEGCRVTENAYPVYRHGATAATDDAVGRLGARGILSFGRQGGFDYQPTAGISTLVAEERCRPIMQ